MKKASERYLWEIAEEINEKWPRMYFGAAPYVNAMRDLETIDDNYINDSGKSVVLYFLANASCLILPKFSVLRCSLRNPSMRCMYTVLPHFLLSLP